MIYLIFAFPAIFLLYILSTYCKKVHPGLSAIQGWAYAHRGLHGNGVPENSLEAFRRARDAGYGSELDVHLLADGNLAIMHDHKLERTTGMLGIIEELSTSDLPNYKLEGTEETIPLFSDVLQLYNGAAPLIVELKATSGNICQLCEKTCQMLDSYTGAYCVESFDPRCVYWLRKNRPDIIRGQLTENFFASPTSKLPWIIKFIMRHQILNFITKPDFVAYKYADRKTISNIICQKLWRTQGVSWTLQSQDEHDNAVSEGWIPIFENYLP